MPISSRQGLIDYCLRRLGADVIEVNVSDEQISDRIDDALQFWTEYHFDGVERVYLRAQVEASRLTFATTDAALFSVTETITGETSGATAKVYKIKDSSTIELQDTKGTFVVNEVVVGTTSGASVALAAANAFFLGNWDTEYFDISDAVTGVTRVFNIGGSSGGNSGNLFSPIYQLRMNDMYSLMGTDMIYYSQVKQHLALLDMLLPSERSFTFNRKSGRLHIETNWNEIMLPEMYVVVECFRILDPSDFAKVYDDMFLKRYATALIKRQWGANMSKFNGVKLPGGVELNGQKIFDEASIEIQKIEEEMQSRFELPVDFMVG